MPNYRVYVKETVNLRVEVEADDKDAAREIAIDAIVQDGADTYFVNVESRDVTDIDVIS